MSRIYKKDPNELEVAKVSVSPIKRRKISFKGKLKLAIVVIIVFFILNVTAVVAKTGLINIPIFSSIFYRLPLPTRVILVDDSFKPDPEGMKVTGSQEEGIFNFTLGENELTYILRRALVQKSGKFADNLQLVITPDFLEMSGYQLQPFKANITVKIKPKVVGNKFSVDLIEYKIGNLTIPPFLSKLTLDKYLNNSEKLESMSSFLQIEGINLEEGKLSLIAKIDMQNFLKLLSVIAEVKQ